MSQIGKESIFETETIARIRDTEPQVILANEELCKFVLAEIK